MGAQYTVAGKQLVEIKDDECVVVMDKHDGLKKKKKKKWLRTISHEQTVNYIYTMRLSSSSSTGSGFTTPLLLLVSLAFARQDAFNKK